MFSPFLKKIHARHLSLQQVYFFFNKKPKEWKIITDKYFICLVQNVFVLVISNCFFSLFCVFLLSLWIFHTALLEGRTRNHLSVLHIGLSSNSCNTTLFWHWSSLFFWNWSLLFPLTNKFCLKGAKSIMFLLIWLQCIFSLDSKKAASLLCIQCNDSMKYSTLNAYIFQWNGMLSLEMKF